jgi:hypothetical protein
VCPAGGLNPITKRSSRREGVCPGGGRIRENSFGNDPLFGTLSFRTTHNLVQRRRHWEDKARARAEDAKANKRAQDERLKDVDKSDGSPSAHAGMAERHRSADDATLEEEAGPSTSRQSV